MCRLTWNWARSFSRRDNCLKHSCTTVQHVVRGYFIYIFCLAISDQKPLINLFCFVDGDPSNYLTYFKRAAVYLAIGQAKRAIPDLDRTIELKDDFSQVLKKYNHSVSPSLLSGQATACQHFATTRQS